jgi:hypothetical protein
MPDSLTRANFWSLTSQSQYHSQYELEVSDSRNCGNKIKVSKSLVVLICTTNAAITIFRRYPDGSINTLQPLVKEKGLPENWGDRDYTGLTIGFIENTMNTYVFIS